MKIQNAVQSYKILTEFNISRCELLRRQIEKIENKVTGLQKELSETKTVKSQLEYEKVEQEQELCSVRYSILVLQKYLYRSLSTADREIFVIADLHSEEIFLRISREEYFFLFRNFRLLRIG